MKTEDKMTKDELARKMQETCDFVNNGYSGRFELKFEFYSNNSAAFKTDMAGSQCPQTIGSVRTFIPDPDTHDQALVKAQDLQRVKGADPHVSWCNCDRRHGFRGGPTNCYIVTWHSTEFGNTIREKCFEFVATSEK